MRRRARALMLQGTGSRVGTIVLVAGRCRLFRDAGWRVAPYEAQSMALNAHVATDGGETARPRRALPEEGSVALDEHLGLVGEETRA